eukprot:scaffold46206_cov65-Attheya_sp.AAC.1
MPNRLSPSISKVIEWTRLKIVASSKMRESESQAKHAWRNAIENAQPQPNPNDHLEPPPPPNSSQYYNPTNQTAAAATPIQTTFTV